jgi:serine phosphatase RsbU (regulator of sigma subunit)
MAPAPSRAGGPWTALLAGFALLALGAALARASLPEWRTGPIPPPAFFAARFRELARAIGTSPAAEPADPAMVSSPAYRKAKEAPGRRGFRWIVGSRAALAVEVRGAVGGEGRPLTASYSLDGIPYEYEAWEPFDLALFFAPVPANDTRPLARAVLRPDEDLGPREASAGSGARTDVYPILAVGGRRDYAVVVVTPLDTGVTRQPATPVNPLRQHAWTIAQGGTLLAAGAAAFFILAVRRRIALVNGALVGGLAALAAAPDLAALARGTAAGLGQLVLVLAIGIWTLVLWSTGESLLRTSREGFTTSLDALRRGQLGPRAGRALWIGLGAGAGIAGLRLAAAALAARFPGSWPEMASLGLPLLGTSGSLVQALRQAALAAFAFGLGCAVAPARRAPYAAVAAALVALPLPALHPWPLALAVGLAVAAAFVELGRRAGLTSLLTAGLAATLLPTAVFAAGHLDWLGGTFGAAAGASGALLALGAIGLSRSAEVELGRVAPPAFVQRIEEERRVRYEMDLLTRMQVGLLPASLPDLAGWEVAARSLLANEAGGDLYDFVHEDGTGRLWIAAGDVAGHGYSCAIVQAMTVAALTSLIAPGRTPAGVLAEIDRVLRRGGAQRNFTTLALLRLDPATGEALFANAGHPYPLLLAAGAVREIEVPGLPLGQGPRRDYADVALALPPGSILVLASDGLFEGADGRGGAYGFARPAAALRAAQRRPADAIVEALLADWRAHLGGEQPGDDTTVLVIKRRGEGAAATAGDWRARRAAART